MSKAHSQAVLNGLTLQLEETFSTEAGIYPNPNEEELNGPITIGPPYNIQHIVHVGPHDLGTTNDTSCTICRKRFSFFNRKFHCRLCDSYCCYECSQKEVVLAKDSVSISCFCLSNSIQDQSL